MTDEEIKMFNHETIIEKKKNEIMEEFISFYGEERRKEIEKKFSQVKIIPYIPMDIFIQKVKDVKKNKSLSQEWRVLVSKASPGGDDYPHAIFSTPLISEPGSVSTETYLVVDRLKSEEECLHLIDYMKTRFFRFLVSLIKTTQNISKGCFAFVPVQDLQEDWTDEKLYLKYGITATEQAFIDSLIRPIE